MGFRDGGWIVILVGGVFFVIGGLIAFGGAVSWLEARQLSTQPTLNLQALEAAALDETVLLEGTISENNTLQFRSFVAYYQDRYDGEDCSHDDDGNLDCTSIWTHQQRVIPSIWLDVPGGRTQVINTDYEIPYPTSWQSTEQLIDFETMRYQGLEVGKPIFVKAVVSQAQDGVALTAEFVAGADRETYLGNERSSAYFEIIFGGIFALVGGGLIVIFMFAFKR